MNEYVKTLNKNIDNKFIIEMKDYGQDNNVPIISDEGLSFLLLLTRLKKPRSILEIGTAIGYSAINLALTCSNLIIDTIERDDVMYKEALNNVQKISLQKQVNIINADALELDLKKLKNNYDIIFIDAAKAQYQKFFEKYEMLLSDNGIIICDNLLFHGLVINSDEIKSKNLKSLVKKIRNYNTWLFENEKYQTSFFNIGDGMSVSERVKLND